MANYAGIQLARKDAKSITRKELVRLLASKEVKEVMIYNATLDNMFGISKRSLLSTLELEEETVMNECLKSYSIEIGWGGCLYIY